MSILWRSIAIFLSFLCIAFGQPAWSAGLGLIASVAGYALFWRAMLEWSRLRTRLLLASCWFAAVQLVQLSWLTADDYQGFYIWICWFVLSLLMGLQFGLVSLLIAPLKKIKWQHLIAVPGAWTLMEWVRLFAFSGFTWNPVGLALTGSLYPMQIVALAGIYGASFWVIFTNMLTLKLCAAFKQVRWWICWAIAVLLPYFFGWVNVAIHEKDQAAALSVAIVQTDWRPGQKQPLGIPDEQVLHPLALWEQIFLSLRPYEGQKIDLIVLPEAALPYCTFPLIYEYDDVAALFGEVLGQKARDRMPPVKVPFGAEVIVDGVRILAVNNGYIAQALAQLFKAHLVIGLEYADPNKPDAPCYNAALHFSPQGAPIEMHGKRVLLPMAEEIPFEWAVPIAKIYGISGSFARGKDATVFNGPVPMTPSVCHEETYGGLVREGRELGGELLVNVSNDGWYPNSRLPEQHFFHGRLRAVEEGAPLIRSTNLGISAAVDSLGHTLASLDANQSGALFVQLPLTHYTTFYSLTGNSGIVIISILALATYLIRRR